MNTLLQQMFGVLSSTEMLSTIVGAIIGAAVSYIVARQTSRENQRVAQDARRDDERAATFKVGLKLMEIVNAAAGYHHSAELHIKETLKRTGLLNTQTWLVFKAFSGRPVEISLSSDDLVAFWQAKEFTYISRLLFLFSLYNSMIFAVAEYGSRREALMAKIHPDEMIGLIGSIDLNSEQMQALAPEIAAVGDLANQMRDLMKEVYESSLKVSADYKPIVRKYFKDPYFPVPIPTGSSEDEAARPPNCDS